MSERLELLRPTLSKYQRRFTVLDLGAGINHPTLGYEISQAYDAVVVEVERGWQPPKPLMWEGSMVDKLEDLKAYYIPTRTIVLKHEFTVADLQRLSECEHFDVVLAFNFIHWFEAEWQAAADAILSMGDYVFVQIPTEADSANAPGYAYVEQMNGYLREHAEYLGSTSQFPGHPPRPIYMRGNGIKRLTRTNWDAPLPDAEVVVYSTHKLAQGSFQHKTPREHREWIPGINLWTFCRLGGVVPSKAQVLNMLDTLQPPSMKHGDIQPWNMILDGEGLHLIDGGDAWGGDDREGLTEARRKVEECLKD